MPHFPFEQALKLLVTHFPNEPQKKPILFHAVRVGTFLWHHGYSEEMQIAGLLHDALEDTDIDSEMIREQFGSHVLGIVEANSKNKNLPKEEILEDIVRRCANFGLDALVVKSADVYDNYLFYKKTSNIPEIERCQTLARLVLQYRGNLDDPIFRYMEEVAA